VGGIAVHPGDLLHADTNGVTAIPQAIGSEVAHVAAEYVAAENVILNFLKTGSKDVKQFSEARKECMRQLGELSRRVGARRASA
jgi:regulator of RNase E activity RraA